MTLRIKTAAGSLALLLSLGACGIGEDLSERSPEQIVKDARAIANSASSVHVTGSVIQEGTENKIDILLTNSGDGKDELSSGGQTISVVKVGNKTYAKGLPGMPPGYQELPANNPQTAELAKAVDKKLFLQEILGSSQTFTMAGEGKVGDQDTLKLTTNSGKSTLHVANDADNPYPLRIEGGGGNGGKVSITFSEWDEDAEITAPKIGS